MAKGSLEYFVEQVGMEHCRKHPMFKGKKMFHEDEDVPAESDCLVFRGIKGQDRLDGIKGSVDVDLQITYRSSTSSAKQNDLASNAIDESFRPPYAVRDDSLAGGVFDYFRIEDAKSSERDNFNNMRKRIRRIPIVARLKGVGGVQVI